MNKKWNTPKYLDEWNTLNRNEYNPLDHNHKWVRRHHLMTIDVYKNLHTHIDMLNPGFKQAHSFVYDKEVYTQPDGAYRPASEPLQNLKDLRIQDSDEEFALPNDSYFRTKLWILAHPYGHAPNRRFVTFMRLKRQDPEDLKIINKLELMVTTVKRETGHMLPKRRYRYQNTEVFVFRSMG